jgi:TPR repeat protein
MQFSNLSKTLSMPRFIVGTILIVASLAMINSYVSKSHKAVSQVEWLSQLARAGDHNAQLQLGLAYREGRYGLQRDSASSEHWLTASAKGGNAYAADTLANIYAHVAKAQAIEHADMEQAVYWWQQAAREGSRDAELQLGEYLLNQGERDKAAAWLRKAADMGETRAHQDLVELYRKSPTPARDLHRGENSLAVLAEQINSTSLKSLLAIWRTMKASSTSTQSTDALTTRAKRGDPVAEFELAMRYRDGSWAVERDPRKAMMWLQRSAAAGNPIAAKTLAKMNVSNKDDMLVSHAASGGSRI